MPTITTRTGKIIDLFNPDPNQITIEDIANNLSRINRWNGMLWLDINVAYHSIMVSKQVDDQFKLQALLHDAPEAYLSDLPGPLKSFLPDYNRFEDLFWDIICEKFGVEKVLDKSVIEADARMAATEATQYGPKEFAINNKDWIDKNPSYGNILIPLDKYNAEIRFLQTYKELTEKS